MYEKWLESMLNSFIAVEVCPPPSNEKAFVFATVSRIFFVPFSNSFFS